MKKLSLNRREFFQLAAVTGAVLALPEGTTLAGPPSFQAPAGVVIPFSGETPPEGWMVADGRPLSPTIYPDLFKRMGYSYGRQGNDFLLPDLRARAIVGQNGEAIWVQPNSIAPRPRPNVWVSEPLPLDPQKVASFINVPPTVILTQIILVEDIQAECVG